MLYIYNVLQIYNITVILKEYRLCMSIYIIARPLEYCFRWLKQIRKLYNSQHMKKPGTKI